MKDAFERRRVVQRTFLGRISMDESDSVGADNLRNLTRSGYRPRVFLNGIEQRLIVSADPDAGTVRGVFAGGGSGILELKGNVSIRLERMDGR